MKILVAGGGGYIGSLLVPELVENGYSVKVIDSFWFGNHLPSTVEIIDKELFSCTEQDFEDVDQVIFLAGLSNDPMAEYSPSQNFVMNGALPVFLAYLAKRSSVKRYIYASSCSVYGYTTNELYNESAPTTCQYPYGVSKLQGEQGVLQLASDDFSTISLRKGTVCGHSPRMRFDLIVNTMFKTVLMESKIVVNNPSIWRPIIDIRDVVRGYVRAVQAEPSCSGIFNLLGENYTVGEVANIVKEELKVLLNKEIKMDVNNIQDFRNYKVSGEKASTILGFNPRYGIENTVLDLFNHHLDYDIEDENCYNIRVFKSMVSKFNNV